MAQLFRNLLWTSNKLLGTKQSFQRSITTANCVLSNYEGDGKTIVTILNRELRHLVMIDTVSILGFRLNNGILVVGPMAVFPRTVLQWNVGNIEDITPESLSLFALLEPKLDILVIGTGDKLIRPKDETLAYLKKNKIGLEILPTEQACSTFNFLNADGRCVAGAFLPPLSVNTFTDEDVFKIIQTGNVGETGYIM